MPRHAQADFAEGAQVRVSHFHVFALSGRDRSLAKSVRGFGRNGRAPYAFLDRDHLAPNDRPVREKLTAYLREQGIELGGSHRVELVTLPRVLGYIFNPVSFFFCYEAAGRPLCAVVEVGIRLARSALPRSRAVAARGIPFACGEDFYVSPFSSLDTEFDFKLRLPGERLDVRIDDYKNGALTLVSALTGERAELTTRQLWWFTLNTRLSPRRSSSSSTGTRCCSGSSACLHRQDCGHR